MQLKPGPSFGCFVCIAFGVNELEINIMSCFPLADNGGKFSVNRQFHLEFGFVCLSTRESIAEASCE